MKIPMILSKVTEVAWYLFAISLVIFLLNIVPASYKAGFTEGLSLAGSAGGGDLGETPLQIEVSPGYAGFIAIATGVIALVGTLSKTISDIATANIGLKIEQEKHRTEKEKYEAEKIRQEMQLREVEILKLELEKEKLEQSKKGGGKKRA